METMVFQYTMTREDYLKGMRRYFLIRRRWWLPLVILFSIYLLYQIAVGTSSVYYWLLLLLMCFLLAFVFILYPLQYVYRLQKRGLIPDKTDWHIAGQDIVVNSKLGETKTTWQLYSKMYETKYYFLLTYSTSKRIFNIIPKRAFESEVQEEAFKELAEKYIKK